MTYSRAVAALSGLAVLVLAACGAASASHPLARTAATQVAQPAKSGLTAPAPANEQRAEQDAAAILAAFTAPPGARRLTAAPGVAGGVLKVPGEEPATPDLADKAGWWQVAGGPQQVLSWARGHVPHRFTLFSSGPVSHGAGTGTAWEDDFELPAVPGVLIARQLIVEVVSAGGGQAGIRVDAQVTWLPDGTPGEAIPAGATAVTLALTPDVNVHVKPPRPATVTDPVKVRQLTALIGGLPVFPRGTYNCPFNGAARLVLTFSAGAGGQVLAVATVSLEGCQGVDVTVRGRQQTELGSPGGGRGNAARALKLAGLRWELTRYVGST
jgi:hypothetical protein